MNDHFHFLNNKPLAKSATTSTIAKIDATPTNITANTYQRNNTTKIEVKLNWITSKYVKSNIKNAVATVILLITEIPPPCTESPSFHRSSL